jgi:phospholipase C
MKHPNSSSPVTHVVLIIKENHSFDNYFGTLPGADGAAFPHSPNPPPRDPDHTHGAWLTRKTTAVRAQFLRADIPAYFSYAGSFTVCDKFFSEVAGPSTPNHLMLIAADSPLFVNPSRSAPPLFTLPTFPVLLEKAKLTWGNYGGYAFDFFKELKGRNKFPSAQFALDAAAGKLPSVSWVYAPHDASEHPPDPQDKGSKPPVGDVTRGMQWTVDQVNAVVKGGLWPSTAIFITWDDWGGWFDHLDSPEVETWKHDKKHPELDGNHPAWNGNQFRYGPRVGCIVVSPYARSGHVSHVLRSHVSLLKFCETNFRTGSLNARDGGADDMSECFDFAQKPLPPPPTKP